MKYTKDFVISQAEKLGWSVRFGEQKSGTTGKTEKYAEFENYSPAGENLVFTEFYDSLSELPVLLRERYSDFDPEEHAVAWFQAENRGQPRSIRGLLDDADEIEKMIWDLSAALSA